MDFLMVENTLNTSDVKHDVLYIEHESEIEDNRDFSQYLQDLEGDVKLVLDVKPNHAKAMKSMCNDSEIASSVETILHHPGYNVLVIDANIISELVYATFGSLIVSGGSKLQFENAILKGGWCSESETECVYNHGSIQILGSASMNIDATGILIGSGGSLAVDFTNDIQQKVDIFKSFGSAETATIGEYIPFEADDCDLIYDFMHEILDQKVSDLKQSQDDELLNILFDDVDSEDNAIFIAYREDLNCMIVKNERDHIVSIVGLDSGRADFESFMSYIDQYESVESLRDAICLYIDEQNKHPEHQINSSSYYSI